MKNPEEIETKCMEKVAEIMNAYQGQTMSPQLRIKVEAEVRTLCEAAIKEINETSPDLH